MLCLWLASVFCALVLAACRVAELHAVSAAPSLRSNVTSEYFSNEDLQSYIMDLAASCKDIMAVFSIGKSVAGVDVLAMDVGQSAGQRSSNKPYFLWVGNMHGDEPSGRQLMLALATHMCQNRTDPDVEALLTHVEVIIVPTMNPDGFASHERSNRAGVDLNRSFPDRVQRGSLDLSPTGREPPETTAIMQLATQLPFAGSANLHEGAVVANYPWDADDQAGPGVYAASPDDAAFRHLAGSYASMHTRMAKQIPLPGQVPMRDVFPGGVTNGNKWYPVIGGMQDWLYIQTDCMTITLELSQRKWPAAHLLQSLWDENRHAMARYPVLASVGGVFGSVRPAGVRAVVSFSNGGRPVYTDPFSGRFYKPMAPGEYTVNITAAGYFTVQQHVTVPGHGPVGVELVVTLEEDPKALPAGTPRPPSAVFPYPILAGRVVGAHGGGTAGAVDDGAQGRKLNEPLVEGSRPGAVSVGRLVLFWAGVVWLGYYYLKLKGWRLLARSAAR